MTYLIQAFDALGNSLDITGSTEGEPCIIEGPSEALRMVSSVKSGVLHDFDADTHTRKRIAWLTLRTAGRDVTDELYVTKWGRKCNSRDRAIKYSTVVRRGQRFAPFYVSDI